MRYTTEQHLQMAKLIRYKARAFPAEKCTRAIKQSNLFLALAAAAAEERGGLYVADFDFDALDPDWSAIDGRVSKLRTIDPEDRKSMLLQHLPEVHERIRLFQESQTGDEC